MKSPLKEVPTHSIINLLHIQLDRHETSLRGGTSKVIHELLDKEDIISDAVSTNKGTLLRTDEARYNQLQPPKQNFRTNLVEGGTKADRSKVTGNKSIKSLGNKNNQSFLPLSRDCRKKDRLHHLDHLFPNNGPVMMKEKRWKTIQPMGLVLPKGPKGLLHLHNRHQASQV